ncbi:hypothetical protein PAHAL_9G588400 [Panicum hallii]|uniref:Uncharacterized protein n=1 Tax=Panicum hallii TaxID=206008 RepID=A0A2S3IUJ8_9POAL|nr:hypothetical protein PAHAL_9G588400 [Panicum hallii]
MRWDHLLISTQFIESFEGINVNLHTQSAVHKREGKARAATAPVRSFHTSPPELGRWRAASRFLPSAALLAPPPPHAPRLRPGRETRVKRSGRISTRNSASPCVRFLVARVCVAAASS